MRFSVRMEKMMVKPYPHYYFVKVDTGLPRHDERTGKMFYQNYDECLYVEDPLDNSNSSLSLDELTNTSDYLYNNFFVALSSLNINFSSFFCCFSSIFLFF